MDLIEIIILLTIAISGTVFGSFFTLAVHRIPRKEDITHERSYCPNCNHKLQFLDLIPVFSYIFLGGKCRYCKNKIRPRYLLLEIFSGLVFLLLGLSYNINMSTTSVEVASFAILILFLCAIFIIGGIDKEKYIIPNGLIIYALIISVIKLLLEVIVIGNNIYSNIIAAIVIPLVFIIINIILEKVLNSKKVPFGMGDIKYISILGLFCGFGLQALIIVLSLILVTLYKLYELIRGKQNKEIAWGFFLSVAGSICLIVAPQISNLINSLELIIKF